MNAFIPIMDSIKTNKKRRLSTDIELENSYRLPSLRICEESEEKNFGNKEHKVSINYQELQEMIAGAVKEGIKQGIEQNNNKNKKLTPENAKKLVQISKAVKYASLHNNSMAAVKFQKDESTIRRWKKKLQDISNDKENNESIPNSAVLDQTENNKKENNNTKNVKSTPFGELEVIY